MKGLAALVSVAELLAVAVGSPSAATELAVRIVAKGSSALPRSRNDLQAATRSQLVETGVITSTGTPNVGRSAELVVVCQILAAATTPVTEPAPEPRLLLTAPGGLVPVADVERLETFIVDTIRQSAQTLHIGGAFWNEDGFETLNGVLKPALARGVQTLIYANYPSEERYSDVLVARLDDICSAGPATVRWFSGAKPRMLHAKFVVRDRSHGYLGTANLTSWGMREHIEAGIELTRLQAERFITFFEQVEAAGLFSKSPPQTGQVPGALPTS